MVAISANRGALAAILAVACLVVTLVVVQEHSGDFIAVREQGNSNNKGSGTDWENADGKTWLRDTDATGHIIIHQDDHMVESAARHADRKFGMFSKQARKADLDITIGGNDDVTKSMNKAIRERHRWAKKIKAARATTAEEIREITDETFHKAMVKKRIALRKKAMREKEHKRLAKLDRKKRILVQAKKDCEKLKRIYSKAVPKNKKAYEKANCDFVLAQA